MYTLQINDKVLDYEISEFHEGLRVDPITEQRKMSLEVAIPLEVKNNFAEDIEPLLNADKIILKILKEGKPIAIFDRYTRIEEVNIQYVSEAALPNTIDGEFKAFIVFSK